MKTKKAQAQIIVTVIIILIVIAAVAIVAMLIMNFVRSRAGIAEAQLACADIQLSITGASATQSGYGQIIIRREVGGGDIKEIRIFVDGTLLDTTVGNLGELESETVDISEDEITMTSDSKIEIAPVIDDGSEEGYLCGIKDTKIVSEI